MHRPSTNTNPRYSSQDPSKPSNHITILTTNVQSITNKIKAIQLLADTEIAAVICITEHWLKKESEEYYVIQGYKKISCFCRPHCLHGGTCIYVQNNIRAIELENIKNNSKELHCEMVGTYLPEHNTVIICVYRSPNGELETFFQLMETAMLLTRNEDKENTKYIITGDFNIHMHTENTQNTQFTNLMASHGLKTTFKEPTRATATSKTCIDNAFTNMVEIEVNTVEPGYGDHKALVIHVPSHTNSHNERIYTRKYSQRKVTILQQRLEETNWSVVNEELSPNKGMNILMDTLTKHHNDLFPLTLQKVDHKPPKLSPVVTQVRETLNLMRRMHDSRGDQESYQMIKSYEKFYIKLVEEEHRKMNTRKILNAQDKSKVIWQTIHQETRPRKPTHHPESPSSEEFSQFFSNITHTTTNIYEETLSHTVCHKTLFLRPTDHVEIENVTLALKSKCGEDVYGISTKLLKQIITHISIPLATIFNNAMTKGIFPEKLKIARITPIFKKGDKSECQNYRPISVLPTISKILEELILSRLLDHFQQNNLFSKEQYAYQPGRGTEDAIKKLVETVSRALEQRLNCKVQMCDLSRAFDCVAHDILLRKMECYGIRGVAQKLLKSYLTQRLQQVRILQDCSTFKETSCGVPQGSLLGGILFIVFINDLPTKIEAKTIIYADDTTLITTTEKKEEITIEAERHMMQAKHWFDANKLTLNEAKTENITFTMDRWQKAEMPVRFLGIELDPRLSWASHIEKLAKTLSKITFAIRRVERTAGLEAARVAYMSMFHARMLYGIETWGHSIHTKTILLLQKRAVRSLTSEHPMTHAKPLFKRHNILTVYAAYLLRFLMSIHKNKTNMTTHADQHAYLTRNRNNLRAGFSRLTTTAYFFRQVNIYNTLPACWKDQPSKTFQRSLKCFLIKTAPYSIDEFKSFIREETDALNQSPGDT